MHHAHQTKKEETSNWVGDKKLLGKLAYPDQSSDPCLRFPNPSLLSWCDGKRYIDNTNKSVALIDRISLSSFYLILCLEKNVQQTIRFSYVLGRPESSCRKRFKFNKCILKFKFSAFQFSFKIEFSGRPNIKIQITKRWEKCFRYI